MGRSHSLDVLTSLSPVVPATLARQAEDWDPSQTPVPARCAASVVLCRDGESGLETYLLHRHARMAFAASMVVFPGGGVDPVDRTAADPLLACGIRETWEETGVELAHPEVVRWAHWITPVMQPIRYDTYFYLAALPPGQTASDRSSETERAAWTTPAAAVTAYEAWRSRHDAADAVDPGRAQPGSGAWLRPSSWHGTASSRPSCPRWSAPPTAGSTAIPALEAGRPDDRDRARHPGGPGAQPGTHDAGRDQHLDPGRSRRLQHRRRPRVRSTRVTCAESTRRPGEVADIVLTHRHLDHSEGLARFAELTGSGVRAADPAYAIPTGGTDGRLDDGLELSVGDLAIRVVATPGHTSDSTSLLVSGPTGRWLLTGDMVLGRGTTVITHPDGDLGAYLSSLDVLLTLVREHEVTAILPGHGPVVTDPEGVLTFYREHRQQRLDQVRAALRQGDTTPAQVVARVYADVDRSVWPAAEQSVRAQLDYLRGS